MRRRPATVFALVLALLLAVSGCTSIGLGPRPDVPTAEAGTLASALGAGKLDGVTLVDSAGAQDDLTAALGTMGALPKVTVGTITVSDDSSGYIATADLTVAWTLPGGDWSYQTQAVLEHDSEWKVRWTPAILHPQLTAQTRLVRTQALGDRGSITDRNGTVIAGLTDGYRIGLDKTYIGSGQWESSARALAKVLDINADNYVKKVKAYGAKAWVPAATVAGYSAPAAMYDVPGATAQKTRVYAAAPGRASTFAQPVVGVTGEASAEVVKESNGEVLAGDIVGVSGLQLLYDKQLRGTAGVKISIAARPAATASASPSGSATATGQASATPSSATSSAGAAASEIPDVVVLERKAVAGTTLKLTLDTKAQELAETVLASSAQAALVAVNPSTGEILAAATTADSELSIATQGRYPAGSTFKVITSLALLRKGLTEQSTVTCNSTTTVDGRTIKNYSDYPSSKLGSITLRTAFAESCNTAFVSNYGTLDAASLADAAGSLGVGIDYEPGFYSFWGSVPSPSDPVARAEAMIGQGEVLVSPLSMAAVASSVAAGKTVVPSLIPGTSVTPTGTALSGAEAKTLQSLMSAVVDEGSGSSLKGIVTGAKSGTAQYGSGSDLKTHAWMIGYKGTSLAVSAFVYDGTSGTRTAGPLLSAFVKGMS
ncbi:penicillin-binding transpeptidase domain-containing protein [Propionicicella superfundia]|uniref:penicillin-binding transpeptidase domain-containing protein n=1 Tax=Propionicicella superfundia TaxID=348582 RepID=UPI0003FFC815|nr:penicillin-binding transpeptidase domain-containing protein [Propionicicella superfundia]